MILMLGYTSLIKFLENFSFSLFSEIICSGLLLFLPLKSARILQRTCMVLELSFGKEFNNKFNAFNRCRTVQFVYFIFSEL